MNAPKDLNRPGVATRFLRDLRRDCETHPATNHLFLARCAVTPYTREDYATYAAQHFPLVAVFTRYLENLLLRGPDSESKHWLAKVLVDEYGEGSEGRDHADLYRGFMHAAGAQDPLEHPAVLVPEVADFLRTHLTLTARAPFLVGLGAVGPGHEWSIPHMFELLIEGLRLAGFRDDEIGYFTLHIAQDEDHGAWLEEAIARSAETAEGRDQIHRGAMLSLEARYRFWGGIQRVVGRWRSPAAHLHLPQRLRERCVGLLSRVREKAPLGMLDGLHYRHALTLHDVLALAPSLVVPVEYRSGAQKAREAPRSPLAS
jgi:pyrroloquinoline quinone (PQQ) biosynthesis protein C